jgi:methionine-rich copper-binding protein CopC
MRTSNIMAAALAALLALAGAAHAHTKGETVPADGAEVAAPEEVVLRFDMPMRVTAISLEGEGGAVALASEQGTDPVTEYVAAPEGALDPGPYEVEWRGLSADGHPMRGSFGFTVAE